MSLLKLGKGQLFRIFVLTSLAILTVVTLATKRNVDLGAACRAADLSGEIKPNEKLAIFEGRTISVPDLAILPRNRPVLGVSNEERWIEVDISEQKLKAWEGDHLFLETLVSTGLPWTPTPAGTFYIESKLRATKMEGGEGKYYYYLPNVPYVMFFENETTPGALGFSLHGTYWHNDFGKVHSHGCVNLPTPAAEKLYYWTSPLVPEGKGIVKADKGNSGTRVVIHE